MLSYSINCFCSSTKSGLKLSDNSRSSTSTRQNRLNLVIIWAKRYAQLLSVKPFFSRSGTTETTKYGGFDFQCWRLRTGCASFLELWTFCNIYQVSPNFFFPYNSSWFDPRQFFEIHNLSAYLTAKKICGGKSSFKTQEIICLISQPFFAILVRKKSCQVTWCAKSLRAVEAPLCFECAWIDASFLSLYLWVAELCGSANGTFKL